jgi:hypothetical protein
MRVWFVHAERNKTAVDIPVVEGQSDALKIVDRLIKFGWKNVKADFKEWYRRER